MSNAKSALIWFVFGAVTLAALWLAIWKAPQWADVAGFSLLIAPLAAALVTFAPELKRDRVSALCILGLGILFLLAWFV